MENDTKGNPESSGMKDGIMKGKYLGKYIRSFISLLSYFRYI